VALLQALVFSTKEKTYRQQFKFRSLTHSSAVTKSHIYYLLTLRSCTATKIIECCTSSCVICSC